MMRNAASSLRAFKSFCFVFTMSITCLRVTLPTLVLLGSLEPAAMLAAFFNKTAAGGLLVMKVNDLSLKTVITTGRISPACFWVVALNSLQNAMMFTPRGPRAVPTGGAGLAWPAGIWSLISATFSFAAINFLDRMNRIYKIGFELEFLRSFWAFCQFSQKIFTPVR